MKILWAGYQSPLTDGETEAQACDSWPKTAQLVSGKTGIWTQVSLALETLGAGVTPTLQGPEQGRHWPKSYNPFWRSWSSGLLTPRWDSFHNCRQLGKGGSWESARFEFKPFLQPATGQLPPEPCWAQRLGSWVPALIALNSEEESGVTWTPHVWPLPLESYQKEPGAPLSAPSFWGDAGLSGWYENCSHLGLSSPGVGHLLAREFWSHTLWGRTL